MARVFGVMAAGTLLDIDIAGIQVDVDEHRLGTQPRDDVRARRKTHRRHDDFIARADAGHLERHFQAGGGGGHDSHVAIAHVGTQGRFEGGHLRAAGQLPRAQHVADGRNALLIDRRTHKGKKGFHTEFLDTSTTPAQMSAIPMTLPGVRLSPSHNTDTAATTT